MEKKALDFVFHDKRNVANTFFNAPMSLYIGIF